MQDEGGLQLYDFHARQYDPQIGRFWGIDPADQFPSGYTGMGNDPGNQIDPSGMSTVAYSGGGGSVTQESFLDMSNGEGYSAGVDYSPDESKPEANGASNGEGQGVGSTEVFTTTGQPIGLLNDNYLNQIHFVDLGALGISLATAQSILSGVNSSGQDVINSFAGSLRASSTAYIGLDFVSMLKSVSLKSAATGQWGKEQGFYNSISANRQLTVNVFNAPLYGLWNSQRYPMGAALSRFTSEGGNMTNFFSVGHTHMEYWYNEPARGLTGQHMSLKDALIHYQRPSPPTYDDGQLSMNDYTNHISRVTPLIIGTPVGITIYNINSSHAPQDANRPAGYLYWPYNWFKNHR